ncbi:hypothetical protein BOTBODRAFT_174271 [Botryobasidium botryosum FD-172 SS1]|uniref:SET domain-containing protein n=1 Tax=Botryobasidium botryosum (strain FD-172 SS1) TaxID=930990 RepID=A0A067MU42_BOTB1|nr:hypothetical protein BOTBODRAFT_174271 [Botryobasidium botryosum FD-172 SS1]
MDNDTRQIMATALGLSEYDLEEMMAEFSQLSTNGGSSVGVSSNETQSSGGLGAEEQTDIDGNGRQNEGGRPGPASPPSTSSYRTSLLHSLAQSRAALQRGVQGAVGLAILDPFNTYAGYVPHYSSTPLSKLCRIQLSEMQTRKVHKGHYLLCRLAAPPTRLVATQACIEDPTGDVCSLSIYNYPGTRLAPANVLDTIFPMGAILAIREPYLGIGLYNSDPFIHVNSPSDIVFIKPSDSILDGICWKLPIHISTPVPQTMCGWKDVGDGHFRLAQYFAAVIAYSNGLDLDPNAYVLQLNRAVAYLRLEYFPAALSDAEAVLPVKQLSNEMRAKALFRAAQAEYGLGRYQAAAVRLEESHLLNSRAPEPIAWLTRCEERLQEVEGKYDWVRMFEDAMTPGRRLDVAEYVGPIRVQPMPTRGGGRGVVTTRAVKAGELLLVAKPFVACFPEELSGSGDTMPTHLGQNSCRADAVSQLFVKLAANQELAPVVLDLYAGPKYPAPPSEYPPPAPTGIKPRDPRVFEIDLDIQQIEHICADALFIPETLNILEPLGTTVSRDPMKSASALYSLPSLFNHSCLANGSWSNFKDIMVIRAEKDIYEGEEITIPYADGPTLLSKAAKFKKYAFSCDCALCEADRRDGVALCRRREELLSSIPIPLEPRRIALRRARAILSDMEATYSASRGPVRSALARAHNELAGVYALEAQTNPSFSISSITENMAAIEALGIIILDKSTSGPLDREEGAVADLPVATTLTSVVDYQSCMLFSLALVSVFNTLGDVARAKRWFKVGLWLDDVSIGGGRELFNIRYKKMLEFLDISDLSRSVAL